MNKTSTTGPNQDIHYSAADKLKAVKLYLENGYPANQVAEYFGIGKSSLFRWTRTYRTHGATAFTMSEDAPRKASAEP